MTSNPRIGKLALIGNPGGRRVPALALALTALLVAVAASGCLDESDFLPEGPAPPLIVLDSVLTSDDSYNVIVIKVSTKQSLENFSFFLKDEVGLTHQFGEIALQNFSGNWHGVDVTWDDDGSTDTNQGNGLADRAYYAGGPYPDPYQAQVRIDAVQSGSQPPKSYQKGEGTISVSFTDNDRDGKLSPGDQFMVLGNSQIHSATNDWTLEILYDPTGDLSGAVRLGEPGDNWTPAINLTTSRHNQGDYQVQVVSVSAQRNIENYLFWLKEESGITVEFGEIALQNISGQWHGVDVTWDDDGSADVNPGNGKADRAESAGGPYTDPAQAQTRIDAVQAGTQTTGQYQKKEGTISVSFSDNDRNGKLSAGDQFLIQGNDATHFANDDWTFALLYGGPPGSFGGEQAGSVRLGEGQNTPYVYFGQSYREGEWYMVSVVKTSLKLPLEEIQYYLKDSNGTLLEYGEIALQNLSGRWQGVDLTWEDNRTADANPGNGRADRSGSVNASLPYSDPRQAQVRIEAVQAGYQSNQTYQRNEGTISVSFDDNDHDGRLTPGDLFTIRDTNATHQDIENLTFELHWDTAQVTVAWLTLTTPKDTPIIQMASTKNSNGDYIVWIIKTSMNYNLEKFQYYLEDEYNQTQQFGEIALQNLSGQWHGVDVTWDDDGSADTNQGNGKADRAESADGPYTDPTQAQTRIDAVQAGNQTTGAYQKAEGTISVSFSDNDRSGKLSSGDQFFIQGNDSTHTANDDWIFHLMYDPTGDTVDSVRLSS